MSTKINLNGQILEDASISVFDHGFLFGDSIYEVICTHNGQPCFVKEHLHRLRQSAFAISLSIPLSDEQFWQEIQRTVRESANPESYIRIVVTRGVGEIDIDPGSCTRPNVLIYVTPLKAYPQEDYEKGIHIALVSIKRNFKEALNPGIKTGNYLNNVLAKLEANQLGAKDALMLNSMGYLTECTTSNIFFIREGRIMTPSLECGILDGITRQVILRLARENGFLLEEGQWPPEEIQLAEEAFITGTLKQIMPVTLLDGRLIKDGKPGPVTIKLMSLYHDLLEKEYGQAVKGSVS